MRNRAGIILYCKAQRMVLLIRREKTNKIYWVVPGGGLYNNESFEEAAKRELLEEIGFCAEEIKEAITLNLSTGIERYYVALVEKTDRFTILGEEAQQNNRFNAYIPEWVSIDKISDINLLPNQLISYILENMADINI